MPLSPAALRRFAFKNVQDAGPDWQQKLSGWWVVGLRRPDCVVARPVLVVPGDLLFRATECAQIDGAGTGESIAVTVSVVAVRVNEWLALYKHLEYQAAIDDKLDSIAAATDAADVDEWPF